uniref:Putative ovule protein n=1 Tax=Solanum chacoense TaxID=4108 RepID=A0A0V0HYT8_SOLCH
MHDMVLAALVYCCSVPSGVIPTRKDRKPVSLTRPSLSPHELYQQPSTELLYRNILRWDPNIQIQEDSVAPYQDTKLR